MSWHLWIKELEKEPLQAMTDLLRGAADVTPFERASPGDFLLAILPKGGYFLHNKRIISQSAGSVDEGDKNEKILRRVDKGLKNWFLKQQTASLPPARKLTGYAQQVSEGLQLLLYFPLPETRELIHENRASWINWLKSLSLTAYLDPEFDYWQALAVKQDDDQLQFFWQTFISEAGKTRSIRYLNLGLLALSKLPMDEEDSLRNLRLQIQALANRYQQRKNLGVIAQQQLVSSLRSVMVRNPSLGRNNYKSLLTQLLASLGKDTVYSVLTLLGFSFVEEEIIYSTSKSAFNYKIDPPSNAGDTEDIVRAIKSSRTKLSAWNIFRHEMDEQEKYLHKTGDCYHFVRVLDRCGRAFLDQHSIRDPEIESRLFQWIYNSLCLDSEEPRRWMLWELALREAGQRQRAEWVLWEMTRRFPDQVHSRVELARLLSFTDSEKDHETAEILLQQVLDLDPENKHAYSILFLLAMLKSDWPTALQCAQKGLQIDPSDHVSALHLAQAYVRRNNSGDLQTAIIHLERFTKRYIGHQNLEQFLERLKSSSLSSDDKNYSPLNAKASIAVNVENETDPAWKSFGESVSRYLDNSEGNLPDAGYEYLLPLPQALREIIDNDKWSKDILALYDQETLQEFPLEVKLWNYLRVKQSQAQTICDISELKYDLIQEVNSEIESSHPDKKKSWITYLNNHLHELNGEDNQSIEKGKEWLVDLVDRHQPLPAPLFA